MKNIFIFGILLINILSCNNMQSNSNPVANNQQQSNFLAFLKSKKQLEYNQTNDIQKDEFYKYFNNELSHYIDSVKLFINWKGQIEGIKTDEYGGNTLIKFQIKYEPEEYFKLSFNCSHIVKTEKLSQDSLYNKLKSISNFSTVYFDGFIIKNSQDEVQYDDYGSKDLRISYPDYKFNVVDVKEEKGADTLSKPLKNIVDLTFNVMKLLKDKTLKNISEKEWKEKSKTYDLDAAFIKLTESEKAYSKRYSIGLFNQIFDEN